MGIIKAAMSMVGGALADSWLEVIEPSDMNQTTVMCPGVMKARNDSRNTNTKGTDFTVSNGSIIHVYDNQMMLLIDGGAIVDYTAEPGYFEVKNSSLPSLLNGQFGDSLKETFNRFRFSGVTPTAQRVIYINLKPIEGIKFGTKSPVSYRDSVYNIVARVRAHGFTSIDIIDPLLFYKNVIPTADVTNMRPVDMQTIVANRYDYEIVNVLQVAFTKLSMQQICVFDVGAYNFEVADSVQQALEERFQWASKRGIKLSNLSMEVTPSEETQALIDKRNDVAIFNDPSMRETLVQMNVSEGVKAAGSNANGAMAGFMGVGMGMQYGGAFMGNASNTNMQQMQMQQAAQGQPSPAQPVQPQQPAAGAAFAAGGWNCDCGKTGNTGKFCAECGKPKPVPAASGTWKCSCGTENTGKFCAECGKPKPEQPKKIKCDKCGYEPDMSQPIPKFCPECGDPINDADFV